MVTGKSPGPDRYSIMYYRRFQGVLLPKLCKYLNALGDRAKMREESLLAHLTLILKEVKDPTTPASYRMTALLNVDVNIFAKVLADRLKSLKSKWIHTNQVEFVSGGKR